MMSSFSDPVRMIGEGCEDLDEHVFAAKSERRCHSRHARCGASKLAQPGETAAAIVWIMASMELPSSVGSQQVSMNTRCPFTINGSNTVSEVP